MLHMTDKLAAEEERKEGKNVAEADQLPAVKVAWSGRDADSVGVIGGSGTDQAEERKVKVVK